MFGSGAGLMICLPQLQISPIGSKGFGPWTVSVLQTVLTSGWDKELGLWSGWGFGAVTFLGLLQVVQTSTSSLFPHKFNVADTWKWIKFSIKEQV